MLRLYLSKRYVGLASKVNYDLEQFFLCEAKYKKEKDALKHLGEDKRETAK